jgi:transcriptional regulator with XRE-family HTH domain
MTDTILLKKKIKLSGYRMNYVAERLGLSYQGLLNKINNKSEFKAPEIKLLCEILSIDVAEKELIFFS